MRFLFASDSFKGSLRSEQINSILKEQMQLVFPDAKATMVAVADGGEGSIDALLATTKGEKIFRTVSGPLFENVDAYYATWGEGKVLIEMAIASGLPLVERSQQNPLYTSTYGTGELIRDALNRGYRDIVIAIGGSATNDGGIGAMSALGIRFLDVHGKALSGIGANLEKIAGIDVDNLHPAVKEATFTVMCDVNNPLVGEHGATYTFGRQKGADEAQLGILENGMLHYAKILEKDIGVDIKDVPGAGAAGGLGAALMVFLNARLQSGIETILDFMEFDRRLESIDICITGEGRMDWQSAHGKVVSGIGHRCKKKGVPVIAIVGGMGRGATDLYAHGIQSIMTTINATMTVETAMEQAKELYANAANRAFRLVKLGMDLQERMARCQDNS